MGDKLPQVLDECIDELKKGNKIETILADYPTMREQLTPLLQAALSVFIIPKVSPSDEFRRTSKARLMTRLRKESAQDGSMKDTSLELELTCPR